MRCVVTVGPTYEPLDDVRRLTNFSTGRLGTELANFLTARGHEVTLLLGEQATFRGEPRARQVETFTTTLDLRDRLQALSGPSIEALFHTAAVSDFAFGKVWRRSPQGELAEVQAGKIPTRLGPLLVELVPTPKIITRLRGWFPRAHLVGWKYEVDGDLESTIRLAENQIAECHTDACVANGPAFGPGFGLIQTGGAFARCPDQAALFDALAASLDSFQPRSGSK
jgi:phosphopantothenoylcysteine decarboxylase/phosphopantothenate--cysteine ligase